MGFVFASWRRCLQLPCCAYREIQPDRCTVHRPRHYPCFCTGHPARLIDKICDCVLPQVMSAVVCSLTLRLSGNCTCHVQMQADTQLDANDFMIPDDESGKAGWTTLAGTCW